MLKVLKIRSVENAVYTPQYNRMRFKVPMDNLNTHLSQSYLSLQVQPVTSTGANVNKTANIGFGNASTGLYYPTCLLKIVRLFRGDSNVPLEEVQNFNILDQNLKLYEKDMENLVSDQFDSGFFLEDVFQGDKSSFWLEGSADIHISLSEIFGICKNKDFYLSDVGGLQIEIELEDRYKLFVENTPDDLQQTVFVAFDPVDVGSQIISTPISNKNNTFKSLTSDATDVALDGNMTVVQKQLQAVPTDDNFYLAIDAATAAISALDTTSDLYTLTLKVNPTQKINTNKEGEFTAYGINSVIANTVFKTTDWKEVPIQIVYKKGASATLASSEPIYGMPAILMTYTDWATGSPATKAVVTLTTPINFDVTNNRIFAIAFIQNLAIASSSERFIPLNIVNATSTAIPTSLTKFTSNPTFSAIVAANSTVLSLSTGVAAQRTLTIPPANFPSGVTPVEGQLYEVYVQSHGASNGTTVSLAMEYLGDKFINENRYLRINSTSSERIRLLCTNATTGVFNVITSGKSLSNPPSSAQLQAYNDSVDAAFKNSIFDAKTVVQPVNAANVLYGKIYLRRIYNTASNVYTAVEQSSLSYTIPRAELVLVQSGKQSSDDVSKTYSTWKMEPTLIENTTSNWEHQFILEPNVYNSFLISPQALSSAGDSTMVSLTDGINTYRWALDNIDNTNRDVAINKALHHDKLIDTFNNGDIKLRNLVNDMMNDKDVTDIGLVPMKIYAARDNQNVYMNNKSHTLQVALKSAADELLTPKNLFLYKQILKTL